MVNVVVGEVLVRDGFQIVRRGWFDGTEVRLTSFTERYLRVDALKALMASEMVKLRGVYHRNVCKVRESIEIGEVLYVVHEKPWAGGRTLQDYVSEKGRMGEGYCRTVFSQLVAGLLHYHCNGVAHWDVHPRNVWLQLAEGMVLLNMGIGPLKFRGSVGVLQLVPEQLTCRAPEIFDGRTTMALEEGRQADTWSCGVVLYYMACGYLPFKDTRIRALRGRVRSRDPLYYPPWVSTSLRDLIDKLLQPDRHLRVDLCTALRHPWLQMNKDGHQREDGDIGAFRRLVKRLTTL